MKSSRITLGLCVAAALSIASAFTSCSDDTGLIGVYPQQDAIETSEGTFDVLSSSIPNNNVPANSTACYLGRIIDPETDKAVTATFAAQFHTFENYAFPDEASIIKHNDKYKEDDAGYLCDSIEIRLVIKSIFGDKNNPMKIKVSHLSMSQDRLLTESEKLYTNTDLSQFVNTEKEPTIKVFTATDYTKTEAQRSSKNYVNNIRIVLDRNFGNDIMKTFYSNPEYFRDSYSFIRKVCPGFLFSTVGGIGTMLQLEVCTLDLFFSYKKEEYPDSTIAALCRFAATPEVIQSTQFESSDLSGLIDKMNDAGSDTTMLKSPAGICTELVLPIDEIYKGHEKDSISLASITLQRINNQDPDAKDDDYALGIPQNLLLVRKQNLQKFFDEHQVSDSQQSFTTAFKPTYNCYTFSNISQLITYCKHEKATGMKTLNQTEEDWEKDHPDWNHVVLVPVTISTTTNGYGEASQVSVNQDMSLCSTKLVRGTNANPIKIQVIYSRFANN